MLMYNNIGPRSVLKLGYKSLSLTSPNNADRWERESSLRAFPSKLHYIPFLISIKISFKLTYSNPIF